MRLTEFEIKVIKDSIKSMDPDANVFLFGSRTDDTKKGGDIDLLILSSGKELFDKLKLKMKICEKIGWQKIDIIISNNTSDPFVNIALSESIKL